MPLDGHSYLISQGWEGKGSGLRQGAISRPLAIPQKKNLAGLGKDRDEAFPFWDHLFTAAAKSIQVKCLSDEGEGTGDSSSNEVSIKRTSTGIFSTKRPIDGTPATSGTITPIDDDCGMTTSRLSLMAMAKRDAAKRGLYSRFFRGPVLGPETLAEEERRLTALVVDAFRQKEAHVEGVRVIEQTTDKRAVVDPEVSKSSHKKRKTRDSEDVSGVEVGDDDEETRRERKRQRKKERLKKKEKEESQEVTRAKKKEKKKVKESGITASQEVHAERSTRPTKGRKKSADESEDDEETKCRRSRREEKKRIKAFRKLEMKEMTATERPTSHPKNENPSKSKSKVAVPVEELTHEVKKKKKKRKRSGSPKESE